jgi:hypothetical protein
MKKKILEEVFKAGTNWGVTFSTWFTPTEENHKKRFEEEINKILSNRTSEVGVEPEVKQLLADLNNKLSPFLNLAEMNMGIISSKKSIEEKTILSDSIITETINIYENNLISKLKDILEKLSKHSV